MNYDTVVRLIIFRQGQFGDTLAVFPVIEAISKLFPEKEIIYCTNHFKSDKYVQARNVLRLSPFISQVVTYNVEDTVYNKYMDLKRKLNPGPQDLLVYLPYSRLRRLQIIRDWLFFRFLKIKNMICFSENWNWVSQYKKTVSSKNIILPKETDRIFGIVRQAGMKIGKVNNCALKCDEGWAEEKMEEWGLRGKALMAICPGSKMQSKRWPLERFIEAGQRWHELSGMHYIVVGGEEESSMAEKLISSWSGYGFSICGATISQTAGMLKNVRGYLGNDTGSMHLSALLGVPCLAIFSDRAPAELWHPYGSGHTVLRMDMKCGNCNLYECYTDPPPCLDGISVEQVLAALKAIHTEKYRKIP